MRGERERQERQKEPATGPTTLAIDQTYRQNGPQRRRRRRRALCYRHRRLNGRPWPGLFEAPAVLLRALFYLLSRSCEYRVCGADHEQGFWAQLVYLRAWRRRFFSGVISFLRCRAI